MVDNPNFDTYANRYLIKGDDNIFFDSTQYYNTDLTAPYDASRNSLATWTPANGFVIPDPGDRSPMRGIQFQFQFARKRRRAGKSPHARPDVPAP